MHESIVWLVMHELLNCCGGVSPLHVWLKTFDQIAGISLVLMHESQRWKEQKSHINSEESKHHGWVREYRTLL